MIDACQQTQESFIPCRIMQRAMNRGGLTMRYEQISAGKLMAVGVFLGPLHVLFCPFCGARIEL